MVFKRFGAYITRVWLQIDILHTPYFFVQTSFYGGVHPPIETRGDMGGFPKQFQKKTKRFQKKNIEAFWNGVLKKNIRFQKKIKLPGS